MLGFQERGSRCSCLTDADEKAGLSSVVRNHLCMNRSGKPVVSLPIVHYNRCALKHTTRSRCPIMAMCKDHHPIKLLQIACTAQRGASTIPLLHMMLWCDAVAWHACAAAQCLYCSRVKHSRSVCESHTIICPPKKLIATTKICMPLRPSQHMCIYSAVSSITNRIFRSYNSIMARIALHNFLFQLNDPSKKSQGKCRVICANQHCSEVACTKCRCGQDMCMYSRIMVTGPSNRQCCTKLETSQITKCGANAVQSQLAMPAC